MPATVALTLEQAAALTELDPADIIWAYSARRMQHRRLRHSALRWRALYREATLMARIVLTDARVRALKPGPKRYFVLDNIVPGLTVDCTPNGHRSFMLRARYPGGSRHAVRRLLGECGALSVDQARTMARDWLGLLAQGLDPQRELAERKRRATGEQALTFGAVVSSYFQHLRGRQAARSRQEIEKNCYRCGVSGQLPISAAATLSASLMECGSAAGRRAAPMLATPLVTSG